MGRAGAGGVGGRRCGRRRASGARCGRGPRGGAWRVMRGCGARRGMRVRSERVFHVKHSRVGSRCRRWAMGRRIADGRGAAAGCAARCGAVAPVSRHGFLVPESRGPHLRRICARILSGGLAFDPPASAAAAVWPIRTRHVAADPPDPPLSGCAMGCPRLRPAEASQATRRPAALSVPLVVRFPSPAVLVGWFVSNFASCPRREAEESRASLVFADLGKCVQQGPHLPLCPRVARKRNHLASILVAEGTYARPCSGKKGHAVRRHSALRAMKVQVAWAGSSMVRPIASAV